jgi:serine/threonine protein kinase
MESDRATPPDTLVGTVLGRYQLERLLGVGGMGMVYAARHQDLGKMAAVKVLHERHDPSGQVRIRFLREGQALSRIRHPNIVDVYDVGTEGGRAYLVMELLEGEDLRTLLAREAPLAPGRVADLMLPVVAAVAAAHDLGVVHRDLKPDNVFLCVERNSISPKVLDFGISKVADSGVTASLTGTGTLLGTPYYMSPEQAKTDKNVDARSDQYSLGVIVYECVTGRRPIDEPAIYQLIQRIVQGDFPTPRQLEPGIPASFEQVILRAMARVPEDRFPTTRALGRALLPFASERVRANYTEELAQDEQVSPTRPLPVAWNPASGLDTTLSQSAHESESSRPLSRQRSGVLPVAMGALLLGLVGAIVWKLAAPPPSAAPGGFPSGSWASSAARVSAESPPPIARSESPHAESTIPAPPAASAPPVASTAKPGSALSLPAPSASVAKQASTRRAARPTDRPELAPR